MNIVKHILETLPAIVNFEGIAFELNIFKNSSEELRLVYSFSCVDKESKHYDLYKSDGCWENPFYEGGYKSFLFLYEAIETDDDLYEAVDTAHDFLKRNNLIQ